MASDPRKWLENNKIYFETIGIIVLSVVGLFIAFESNRISRQQAKTQEYFVRIQSPPLIRLDYWNKTSSNQRPDAYVVINSGGPIYNVKVRHLVLLELVYGPGTDSTCKFDVNLSNIILSIRETGKIYDDVLVTLVDNLRSLRYAASRFKKENEKKVGLALARFGVFLSISYDGSFGRNGREYFAILDGAGINRITRSQWDEVTKKIDLLKQKKIAIDATISGSDRIVEFWRRFKVEERTENCEMIGAPGEWRWRYVYPPKSGNR